MVLLVRELQSALIRNCLYKYIKTEYVEKRFLGLDLTRCLYGNIFDMAKSTLDIYVENPKFTWSGFHLAMSIAFNVQGRYKNELFSDENGLDYYLACPMNKQSVITQTL